MLVNIKKWGNSAAIRLPASLMKSADIGVDTQVNIIEDHGRILIEPIKKKEYSLEALLDGITPKNMQPEIDWGQPVGKEEW
jgi:antitoxin MazE